MCTQSELFDIKTIQYDIKHGINTILNTNINSCDGDSIVECFEIRNVLLLYSMRHYDKKNLIENSDVININMSGDHNHNLKNGSLLIENLLLVIKSYPQKVTLKMYRSTRKVKHHNQTNCM